MILNFWRVMTTPYSGADGLAARGFGATALKLKHGEIALAVKHGRIRLITDIDPASYTGG